MNEEQFKAHYIATFLASWAVMEYDGACSTGQHALLNNPPVEDAVFLADKAWKALQAITA
jgi:hypothetical protein